MIIQLLASAPTCISQDKKQVSIGSLLSNRNRCASCGIEFGLWERRSACSMCSKEHCGKCISLLSQAKIAGDPKLIMILTELRLQREYERQRSGNTTTITTTTEEDTFIACSRCSIVVTREEKLRMYREAFAWGRQHIVRRIYEEAIVKCRQEMEKLLPRYSRLVNSISQEAGKQVFDPFSHPKTVGCSLDQATPEESDEFICKYETSLTVQVNLEKSVKAFERAVKELTKLKLPTESERHLRDVLKAACLLISEDMILPFRVLKKRVSQLQMNKAAQIYLLMYQLVWEDKQHQKFWAQFGQSLLNALSMMKNELMNVVLKAGQDWNSYRQKIEDFLVDWEKFNSALLRISAAEQTEGTVLRKNLTIVKKAIKEINSSIGASKLPETKQALESVQELLNRAYVSYA